MVTRNEECCKYYLQFKNGLTERNYKLRSEVADMGLQNGICDQSPSVKIDLELLEKTVATVNYITDLMHDLQTIATGTGLSILSDDIDSVIQKHRIEIT